MDRISLPQWAVIALGILILASVVCLCLAAIAFVFGGTSSIAPFIYDLF